MVRFNLHYQVIVIVIVIALVPVYLLIAWFQLEMDELRHCPVQKRGQFALLMPERRQPPPRRPGAGQRSPCRGAPPRWAQTRGAGFIKEFFPRDEIIGWYH